MAGVPFPTGLGHRLITAQLDADDGEFDGREVVVVAFVVSSGNGTEVFELVEEPFDDVALFVEFAVEGRWCFAVAHGSHVGDGTFAGEFGMDPIERVRLVRPRGNESMTVDQFTESEWTFTDADVWRTAWSKEVDGTPEFETDTFTLVTGLLLPIWGALPTDDMRVWRLKTNEGERVLGRVIEKDELASVLRKLGHDVEITMTGQELREAVFDRCSVVALEDEITIRRSLNMGVPRIEVIGFDAFALSDYKAMGCTTEKVQYKTRLYVPLPKADDILAQIVAKHPIADVRRGT